MKILVLCLIMVMCFTSVAFAFDTYANEEVYVKDGVTYIIGHPTQAEVDASDAEVKARFERNEKRLEIEAQRRHEIRIETIRASR